LFAEEFDLDYNPGFIWEVTFKTGDGILTRKLEKPIGGIGSEQRCVETETPAGGRCGEFA
jgi:hypothetical protein